MQRDLGTLDAYDTICVNPRTSRKVVSITVSFLPGLTKEAEKLSDQSHFSRCKLVSVS